MVCVEQTRRGNGGTLDRAENAKNPTQELGEMGIEAILGGVAFAGLFGLWVILPSRIRKNRK